MHWKRIKLIAWLLAAAATLWCFNVCFMPPYEERETFVPPSRLFLNARFARKYELYMETPKPDVLILGNSRSMAALLPQVIEAEASLTVRSLAAGGGFFPFYRTVLTELIPDNLPRTLVLCLSPRDLQRDYRRYETRLALVRSSAYQLRKTPYSEPFHTVEQTLGDLHALVLPAFYYKTELLDRLRNRDLSGLWEFPMRSSQYFVRFEDFLRWHTQPLSLSELHNRFEEITPLLSREKKQEIYEKNFRGYRDRSLREVVLWDDPLADPERTMAFLASRDVRVIIAVLPAVMMEGSENNREFYTRFVKHLEHWRLKYSNVAAVLDINNKNDHAYMDPDLYTDLEHMTYDAAVKFSSDFAHLAPLNTSE